MNRLFRAAGLALALIFAAGPALAGMVTPVLVTASPAGAPSNAAARYLGLAVGYASGQWASTAAPVRTPVPTAGAVTGLSVRFSGAPTGAGKYYDITVQKNGSDTALTCRIEDAATTCTDTDSVSFTPGVDDINFKLNPTGSPTAPAFVQIGVVFTADAANRGVIFSGHQSTTTGGFYMPLGARGASTLTLDNANSVFATAGEVAGLHVRLDVAPGVGSSRTYALQKNGSAATLTCTIADTDTSCSDIVGPDAFAGGDAGAIAETQSGSPAASAASIGLEWRPTVDGESLQFATFSTALSTGSPRYGNLNGQTNNGLTSTTLEADGFNLAPMDFVLKSLRLMFSVAPGATKSRTFTARLNGADTALTQSVANSDVSNANVSDQVSVTAGDRLSLSSTPTLSPATAAHAVGFVTYVAPPPAANGNTPLLMRSGGR